MGAMKVLRVVSGVAVSAALIVGAGCSASAEQRSAVAAPRGNSCDLAPRVGIDPCPSCGVNSPMINVFPYNGLHPDGCLNDQGAGLVRQSLDRALSPCDPGGGQLHLDVAPA